MTTRMTYLCYPIDQREVSSISARENQALIERAASALISNGCTELVFDPGQAFTVHHEATIGPEIATINKLAAETADTVVAFLPKGVATVGVPIEIDRAVAGGKYVAIVSDAPAWMLAYADSNKVRRFTMDIKGVDAMLLWLGRVPRQEAPTQEPMSFDLDEGAVLPYRSHPDDAGLDLVATQDMTIHPGQFVDVPCGAKVQLPDWSWGLITGRSSTLRKRGLMVNQGVIDAGYRGPLFAGVWNLTDEVVTVARGERLAQLIVLDNGTQRVRPVQGSINQGSRGANGFGSTGS